MIKVHHLNINNPKSPLIFSKPFSLVSYSFFSCDECLFFSIGFIQKSIETEIIIYKIISGKICSYPNAGITMVFVLEEK